MADTPTDSVRAPFPLQGQPEAAGEPERAGVLTRGPEMKAAFEEGARVRAGLIAGYRARASIRHGVTVEDLMACDILVLRDNLASLRGATLGGELEALAQSDPGTPHDSTWAPWRKGATAPLDRLEEIRAWLDGAWPESFREGALVTWLMVDIGWCKAALRAATLGAAQPEPGPDDDRAETYRQGWRAGYEDGYYRRHGTAPDAQPLDVQPERERLAKMCDEKAEAFEVDAEEWGEVDPMLDTRAPQYARQDAARAADWRKIASALRAPLGEPVAWTDGANVQQRPDGVRVWQVTGRPVFPSDVALYRTPQERSNG